ncbi:MAG TPA: T9SS type A sorting domain-containing protein [Bacteroidia bacterium]|nr:T9SS type A sorting domain-containing protein [Bacteroidia bacterium]
MKKIITSCIIYLLLLSGISYGQNAYCDSIAIDSVYIDNNMLHLTVYNSSQHFIVYPYFTVDLNSNSYITLTDSFTVLSFLSIAGDANNGFSSAGYSGTITASNLVPLNSFFSGTLTITDPNDSTFNCSYPFSFLYGSMTTSLLNKNLSPIQIYPNPSANSIKIYSTELEVNQQFEIINQFGVEVLSGKIQSDIEPIDMSELAAGIYYLRIDYPSNFSYKIIKL